MSMLTVVPDASGGAWRSVSSTFSMQSDSTLGLSLHVLSIGLPLTLLVIVVADAVDKFECRTQRVKPTPYLPAVLPPTKRGEFSTISTLTPTSDGDSDKRAGSSFDSFFFFFQVFRGGGKGAA